MADRVVVRLATPEDAGAIGEAHAEAWRIGYKGLFAPDVLAREVASRRNSWSERMAVPGIEFTKLFVGVCDGGVRGFAHVGPAADGSGRGEVYGFYAHPVAWGTGIAKAMMGEGLSALDAMGFESVCVWTLRDAKRARAFYEKLGYRTTGETKVEDFGQPVTLVEYLRHIRGPGSDS